MSEELKIESVSPSEQPTELVVRIDGERIDPKRPVGRPKSPPAPAYEPITREKIDFLKGQGIGRQPGEEWIFDALWAKYVWWLRIYHPVHLGDFFMYKCAGCAEYKVSNGRHSPACDGVSETVRVLWPEDVVSYLKAHPPFKS